jgi:hypothetical protein
MEDNETFDPNKDYSGGGGSDLPMEKATYLLAISYVHEIGSVGAKRKRRARVKLEALARLKRGNDGILLDTGCKGDTMWQSIWLGRPAWGILKQYMNAMGYAEAWNPHDDDDVRTALTGRPFRASVVPKKNGRYTDLDIIPKHLFPHDKLTDAEREMADAWVTEFEERNFDPAGGSSDEFADGEWSADSYTGDGDGFSDDDIPF